MRHITFNIGTKTKHGEQLGTAAIIQAIQESLRNYPGNTIHVQWFPPSKNRDEGTAVFTTEYRVLWATAFGQEIGCALADALVQDVVAFRIQDETCYGRFAGPGAVDWKGDRDFTQWRGVPFDRELFIE